MVDIKNKGMFDKTGELKSINFILRKDSTIQRVVFEKYSGDSTLTVDDRDKFAQIVSIDIKKEMNNCTAILISLYFKDKNIVINKVFNDRPNEITKL